MGVLFDELRRQGLDRNTLVLFTSDNGSRGRDEGGSNAPLRGGKGSTWEGGQRLPFIAWWPGVIPAGARRSDIVASIDLLPSFAALAGVETPKGRIIDGMDISPLLLGKEGARSSRDTFFYYFRNRLDAVRKGKWKLFVGHAGEDEPVVELYDLENDIAESQNVADDNPDVVEDLAHRIESCREDLGDGRLGIEGKNRRPKGKVDKAKPLTQYHPDHPYIVAMYDVKDAG
jgi:arylsulfatase A-like enzyme